MTVPRFARGGTPATIAALATAAAFLLIHAVPSRAASGDDDLARRTFANADQLMREGKIEQALREFEQVSTAYPDSVVADDALYRVSQYYYPAETADAIGATSAAALQKAKDLLSKITTRYPREESAPRALIKLGLIALDPGNPKRNLDEAYASFMGVVNIYPSSDVVDRALFGAGYADFLARRYDKSIASFERVAEEHAGRPIAEEARYFMGLAYARQGSWIRALEELQAGRDLFPEGRLAPRALDLVTRIYKMKVLRGVSSRPLLSHDTSFAPALDPETLRGEVSLAIDRDNVLHVLDARSGSVYRLGPDGKLASTGQPLPGALSVSVDADGVELLAAGSRIRSGVNEIQLRRKQSGEEIPLEEIAAAAGLGLGRIALLDLGANEVLRLDGDPADLKAVYRDPEGRARLAGLAVGAEGKLYTIDKRARRIIEIDSDGRFRHVGSAPDSGPAFQEPSAIAADDLGDLFVLDRRSDTVTVMTAEGKVLQTITSQPGTPSDFGNGTALAAGPRAEIYIYDEKRKTILRFK